MSASQKHACLLPIPQFSANGVDYDPLRSFTTVLGSMVQNLQLDKNPGGHSLFWAIRVCAAEQGMVFGVLSLKQDLHIHH